MSNKVKIYCFSSNSLTNVFAAHSAKKWAVGATADNLKAKAMKMPISSPGIIYISDKKQLTMPFITTTKPEVDTDVSNTIWHGTYNMPFGIEPLGHPSMYINITDVKRHMPSLQSGKKNDSKTWNHVLSLAPSFVFNPTHMDLDDFIWILERAGDRSHPFVQTLFFNRTFGLI